MRLKQAAETARPSCRVGPALNPHVPDLQTKMARRRSSRIDLSPLTRPANRLPPAGKPSPPSHPTGQLPPQIAEREAKRAARNRREQWLDVPATIGDLIRARITLTAHCRKCGHWAELDPVGLPIAARRTIPSLDGLFRCTRCGSRDSCAMPLYRRPKPGGEAP